ncbi:hypothetical protein HRI_004412500 [Hibiscus trionum]|uniref:Uncharacterized protein n=1 Tax=Hibiscus trionum TaxID=183268 RepID=A0A9W7MMB1_HIBTR|nr:hypothetical protein HRI_004412500 [Hibiscus trionum]
MENRFKIRISRIFRSSFSSCRTRNVSDVVEKAVFSPENHKFQLIEPSSTSSPPPKDCKSRCPRETLPRRKVPGADFNGRKCPPASPTTPLNLFSDCKDFSFYQKKEELSQKQEETTEKGFTF